MSKSINVLMADEGPALHYLPSFYATIESHLPYLRDHPEGDYLAVEPNIAYKYEYDFYGLLGHYGVQRAHHWIIMRINGYTSPHEFRSESTEIFLPSSEVIARIRRLFQVMNKTD